MLYKDSDEFAYHGETYHAPYFEGWYYKITTKDLAMAVIVGFSKLEKEEHAFIQTIDTLERKTYYYRYEMQDVEIIQEPFAIHIQNNVFTKHHMELHLLHIEADIAMYEFTDILSTSYAPTIMGPFSYIKQMQCVHSILSLQHYVRGEITCEKQVIPIQGIGYMEKDRGVSFPKEYIWTQSNTCEIQNCCFFLSIAHIPILHTSFTGCICVLMVNRKQYKFASYYGVRIKQISIHQHKKKKEVQIELRQFTYLLKITIRQYYAYPLIAPEEGMMAPKVFESLDSEIDLKLYHHDVNMYNLHFKQAGCEIRMK